MRSILLRNRCCECREYKWGNGLIRVDGEDEVDLIRTGGREGVG
ncbi:hypothetical protein [Pseudobacter ginsenosidimutans]|nr:hypothetical protein [Pseudobacter ginsenosidimutans]